MKIIKDYYNSSAPYEDFITWFFKRYLNFYGKLIIVILLCSTWFLFLLHIEWIIVFLKAIVIISLIVSVYEIWHYRRREYENNKIRTEFKK